MPPLYPIAYPNPDPTSCPILLLFKTRIPMSLPIIDTLVGTGIQVKGIKQGQ